VVSHVTFPVCTNPRCCSLLQPETYFTHITLKSGLFVILVYVTCLAGESGSTGVQAVHLIVESAHRICDRAYRMYLRGLYIQDVIYMVGLLAVEETVLLVHRDIVQYDS
jgi:hypothetical protein